MSPAAFDSVDLVNHLEASTIPAMDDLPFGLITMDREGTVVGYNSYEAERAGFAPARVLGLNFFEAVAPCTNNYLIAQRYLDEPELDAILDFVFTVRMEPTPVKLRLLAAPGSERQYLAVTFR